MPLLLSSHRHPSIDDIRDPFKCDNKILWPVVFLPAFFRLYVHTESQLPLPLSPIQYWPTVTDEGEITMLKTVPELRQINKESNWERKRAKPHTTNYEMPETNMSRYIILNVQLLDIKIEPFIFFHFFSTRSWKTEPEIFFLYYNRSNRWPFSYGWTKFKSMKKI